MSNLKGRFGLFCAQNAASLWEHTNSMPDRPPDTNVLSRWKNDMRSRLAIRMEAGLDDLMTQALLLKWIDAFQVTYIDKTSFFSTMDSVVEEYLELVQQEKPTRVIFVTESVLSKGSVWLSVLYWSRIEATITDVMTFEDTRKYMETATDRTWTIMLDDAAYSGSSYGDNIIMFNDKPYRNYERHVVIIPYMTRKARKEIQSASGGRIYLRNTAHFLQSSKMMPLVLQQGDHFELSGPSQQFWNRFFGGETGLGFENKPSVYFAHKLADNVSTYTTVIVFAPLPPVDSNAIEECTIGTGLIPMCMENSKEYARIFSAKRIPVMLKDPSRVFPCPIPPYKTYKYNGTDGFPDEGFLEFMRANRPICQGCTSRARYVCGACKSTAFCGKGCHVKHEKKCKKT